jgi:hypothetical protein
METKFFLSPLSLQVYEMNEIGLGMVLSKVKRLLGILSTNISIGSQALRIVIEHLRRLHLNRYKNRVDIHQLAKQFSPLLFKFLADNDNTPLRAHVMSSKYSISSTHRPPTGTTTTLSNSAATKRTIPMSPIQEDVDGTAASDSLPSSSEPLTSKNNSQTMSTSLTMIEAGSLLLVWLVENSDQLYIHSLANSFSFASSSSGTLPSTLPLR